MFKNVLTPLNFCKFISYFQLLNNLRKSAHFPLSDMRSSFSGFFLLNLSYLRILFSSGLNRFMFTGASLDQDPFLFNLYFTFEWFRCSEKEADNIGQKLKANGEQNQFQFQKQSDRGEESSVDSQSFLLKYFLRTCQCSKAHNQSLMYIIPLV